MTKAKFFEILKYNLDFHNHTAKDLEVLEFSETTENLERFESEAPDQHWTAHASGFIIANCWYVWVMEHKTKENASKQAKIFARWIAEYKNK